MKPAQRAFKKLVWQHLDEMFERDGWKRRAEGVYTHELADGVLARVLLSYRFIAETMKIAAVGAAC